MPWLHKPRLFQDWPQDAKTLATEKVIELYKRGFAGAKYNPEAKERFLSQQARPVGEDIAHEFKFADSGKGKLVVPFVHVLEMFPGCWPGRIGQERGDCVSWGSRNGGLTTMVCDIVGGLPDPTTGKVEGKPDVSPEGIADGVLSTEAIYWYRGYNGDGWDCGSAANVVSKTCGLVVRKNYPEAGVDLSRYSGSNGGKYGSKKPPAEFTRLGAQHLIQAATELSTSEARRDFLFNGFGILDCGSEGWDDDRDQWGVSQRQGNWSHSMSRIAFDDRPFIIQKYGEPLECELNSWARFNRGGRDIERSAELVPAHKKELWIACGIVNPATGNIMIPEGSFWSKSSTFNRRDHFAFAGAVGWEAKTFIYDL